jgi:predicted glycosyl hydrolase (DUF1957 family)
MKKGSWKFAGAIALAAALGVFGASSASAMTLETASVSQPAPMVTSTLESSDAENGVLSVWQYNYYQNYFNYFSTCEARGNAMLHKEHVAGMINFACDRNPGEAKWSMDVLWST